MEMSVYLYESLVFIYGGTLSPYQRPASATYPEIPAVAPARREFVNIRNSATRILSEKFFYLFHALNNPFWRCRSSGRICLQNYLKCAKK